MDPELEKIFNKSFENLKKKVNLYIQKKEKKTLKTLLLEQKIKNKAEKKHKKSRSVSKEEK